MQEGASKINIPRDTEQEKRLNCLEVREKPSFPFFPPQWLLFYKVLEVIFETNLSLCHK